MSDVEKIIWGMLTGISVYVLGQLISKFFIEPLYELRKTIGEIQFNLLFYGPTILTPISRSKETSNKASDALSKSSADLFSKLYAVPLYMSFGILPSSREIKEAAVQVRALSTFVHEKGDKAIESLDEIRKRIKKIEHLLRFESDCINQETN